MNKVPIIGRKRKLQIIDRFIDVMLTRESFLLAGHRNPDEDCVASLVAFSLLLGKFNKQNAVVLNRDNWAKYPYLLNICKYNSIRVIGSTDEIGSGYDTVIAFDTPKPEMLDFKKTLDVLMEKDDVLVMEIDHHLEADGTYIGDEGYRFVDEASSTCELIGYMAVKIDRNKNLLRKMGSSDIFSRNFVLSIVTGIVGDSKMGQYLKSPREKRYYRYFSRLFNKMLIRKTDKDSGNFSSIEDILMELDRLSSDEEACYQEFLKYKQNTGRMAWVALDKSAMEPIQSRFDYEVIVTVAKYAANLLAEESGYLSLVAFYDPPGHSNFIQMRMRRSGSFKELDLREVISHLEIVNGGGHEGAVGFRVPRAEVKDYDLFIADIIEKTLKLLGNP